MSPELSETIIQKGQKIEEIVSGLGGADATFAPFDEQEASDLRAYLGEALESEGYSVVTCMNLRPSGNSFEPNSWSLYLHRRS